MRVRVMILMHLINEWLDKVFKSNEFQKLLKDFHKIVFETSFDKLVYNAYRKLEKNLHIWKYYSNLKYLK